jgi:hypothetical protein
MHFANSGLRGLGCCIRGAAVPCPVDLRFRKTHVCHLQHRVFFSCAYRMCANSLGAFSLYPIKCICFLANIRRDGVWKLIRRGHLTSGVTFSQSTQFRSSGEIQQSSRLDIEDPLNTFAIYCNGTLHALVPLAAMCFNDWLSRSALSSAFLKKLLNGMRA